MRPPSFNPGHLPSFLVPTGAFDGLVYLHPREFAIKKKKANAWGLGGWALLELTDALHSTVLLLTACLSMAKAYFNSENFSFVRSHSPGTQIIHATLGTKTSCVCRLLLFFKQRICFTLLLNVPASVRSLEFCLSARQSILL